MLRLGEKGKGGGERGGGDAEDMNKKRRWYKGKWQKESHKHYRYKLHIYKWNMYVIYSIGWLREFERLKEKTLRVYFKWFLREVRASETQSCSRIHRSWLGDKVYSGIYRVVVSARQTCSLVCRQDNPMPELTLSPSYGSLNSATGLNPSIFLYVNNDEGRQMKPCWIVQENAVKMQKKWKDEGIRRKGTNDKWKLLVCKLTDGVVCQDRWQSVLTTPIVEMTARCGEDICNTTRIGDNKRHNISSSRSKWPEIVQEGRDTVKRWQHIKGWSLEIYNFANS